MRRPSEIRSAVASSLLALLLVSCSGGGTSTRVAGDAGGSTDEVDVKATDVSSTPGDDALDGSGGVPPSEDVPSPEDAAIDDAVLDGTGFVEVGADVVAPGDTGVPDPDTSPIDPEKDYFPPTAQGDDSWEEVDGALLGWDTEGLSALVDLLGESSSTAFLVLYRGRILVEHYWGDWDLHTKGKVFSVTKSFVAWLVGKAREEGLISLDDSVTDLLGEGWSNAIPLVEKKITVRHLLTMTSGLNKLLKYEAPAGTLWRYNTPAYRKLQDVLQAVTGLTTNELLWEGLSSVAGLHDAELVDGVVSASARDLARFGLTILSGGSWDGKTILGDAAYFSEMLDSSQELNPAYGYLWWLNGKEGWKLPDGTTGSGPLIPDAPPDLVAALGYADKKIYVVPSMHLVVVRHGEAADDEESALSTFDSDLWKGLVAAAP